ncbi:Carnosine synthase 1 [Perkinsus olseni]|uniref:Carnosine synthase 1 n=1 Tax=Perkinsus olseni TaxID=32597 RepID=A0A7J6UF71_PEROL|nr:Carnosine synthase 1 [Perkinsus olseni]
MVRGLAPDSSSGGLYSITFGVFQHTGCRQSCCDAIVTLTGAQLVVARPVMTPAVPPAAIDKAAIDEGHDSTTAPDNSDSGVDSEVDFSQRRKLSKDFLRMPGATGQQLRLGLLKGANMVFFAAGNRGKQHVYERAAELGVNVIIVDEPNSWVQDLVTTGVAKKYIPLDINTHDHDKLHNDAVEALRKLDRIDGICTVWETSILHTARLCEEFRLPGPPVAAVELARDKRKTRDVLEAAGWPTTRHRLVTAESDLREASQYVGFPAVLKPVAGSASVGVQRVDCYEHLVEAFNTVTRSLADMVLVDGIFVHKNDDIDHTVEFGSFMLEEYLDGSEVDVNIVMSDGVATYVCVHDNGPTLEPHFNETWDIFPSTLPSDQILSHEVPDLLWS